MTAANRTEPASYFYYFCTSFVRNAFIAAGFATSFWLGGHAYAKGCPLFKQKEANKEKKVTLVDLLKDYEKFKKQPETAAKKSETIVKAKEILDYVVGHYKEAKPLIHDYTLNLNELLGALSEQDQKLFCQKAVSQKWFWDFQRRIYFAMFTAPARWGGFEKEYTIMLCTAACSLQKNPIAGFDDEAFKERQEVLKIYAKGEKDKFPFLSFKYSGADGQENKWF